MNLYLNIRIPLRIEVLFKSAEIFSYFSLIFYWNLYRIHHFLLSPWNIHTLKDMHWKQKPQVVFPFLDIVQDKNYRSNRVILQIYSDWYFQLLIGGKAFDLLNLTLYLIVIWVYHFYFHIANILLAVVCQMNQNPYNIRR